jgi:hypothetical protein
VSPRGAALAGMVGAAVFAVVVVFLTFAQLGFMLGLGWKPLGASDVPWPSTLALGPLGWLQVLNFAFFGLSLIVFALGLHRGVASSGRISWAGPAFLAIAGIALVLSAFKTDPPSCKIHRPGTAPSTSWPSSCSLYPSCSRSSSGGGASGEIHGGAATPATP